MVIGFIITQVNPAQLVGAACASPMMDEPQTSVSSPLAPEYTINKDGSVTLRICFNWSCAHRQTITFSRDDMALLKHRLAVCPGTNLHDRLQRVRIGVWQMELLAQKYQPLLANDLAINDFEAGVHGRMDCVDNTSNTTTYLHILRDIQALTGWSVASPKVRSGLDITATHWTAVISDRDSGNPWSIDSWYRPNGHLPMVMPLSNWSDRKKAWNPPFDRVNPSPRSIDDLCQTRNPPGLTSAENDTFPIAP
ncbi:hypothetical protein Thiowin_03222 [Thiorhodovibrio winogradskyi]|uniref:Uncharacterized protein n=2 Tax=Thiorhodovibrio winogradskyi TaxID=77007 RepID=A0ABZ0SCW4_9GAMM